MSKVVHLMTERSPAPLSLERGAYRKGKKGKKEGRKKKKKKVTAHI